MTDTEVPVSATAAPAPKRGLLRSVPELVLGVVIALLVSAAVQLVIDKLPMPRPSNLPALLIMVLGGGGLAVLVALMALRWRPWLSSLGAWICLSGVLSAALSAVLKGSFYYIGGAQVDQSFRTEYLTRLASSPALSDFAYAGTPPFYPAGWFWLAARFANLTGLPAWMAFKPFAILTVAVVAVICLWLWGLVVSKRVALLLATVSTLFAMALGATGGIVPIGEPYSWLAVVAIPPTSVLCWQVLTQLRSPDGPAQNYPVAVLIGILLGVYGCTYTLTFGFAALVLVVLVAVALLWHRRLLRSGLATGPSNGVLLRRVGMHALAVVVPGILVMALVWSPYVIGMFSGESGPNLAAHFLPGGSTELPTPFLQFSVGGVASLLGLCWLVFAVATPNKFRNVAVGLAVTVATGYLWFALSALLVALRTSLLAFRIEPIMLTALFAAGALAVVDLIQRGIPLLRAHWRTPALVLATILGFAVFLGQVQAFPTVAGGVIELAFKGYYPTGHTADGHSSPKDKDFWVPQLRAAIERETGRAPQDNIVAGSPPELLFSTVPYLRFQASSPHYANPLGEFDKRRVEILHWAKAPDSATLVSEMDSGKFRPPNVFVLRTGDDDELNLSVSRDVFPAQPNVAGKKVTFNRSQFTEPQFTTLDVGPYFVAIRN
jgi:galactan 5-O-arabinofuranosyltransferase